VGIANFSRRLQRAPAERTFLHQGKEHWH